MALRQEDAIPVLPNIEYARRLLGIGLTDLYALYIRAIKGRPIAYANFSSYFQGKKLAVPKAELYQVVASVLDAEMERAGIDYRVRSSGSYWVDGTNGADYTGWCSQEGSDQPKLTLVTK